MTIEEAKSRLIRWAESQIGYREGDNNYNKYAQIVEPLYNWLPQNQPWCDTFVDAGFVSCFGLELASKLTYQPIGHGSAACRYSAGFYSAHEAFDDEPQVGDQIFFFYEGGINHTGIVTAVGGGLVHTIEGNTSDMVARRVYSLGASVIAGYGRPDWAAVIDEDPAPEDHLPEDPVEAEPHSTLDISGLPMLRKGDKGEVVRSAQFLLNGRKCSVGIWGADGDFGSGTEAAVLAFQRRAGDLEVDGIIGKMTWQKLIGG